MNGPRQLELRQLDAHVAVAAYGWQWLRSTNFKTVVPPQDVDALIASGLKPPDPRDVLQWLIPKAVPHYSTDRAANDLLVARYDLKVLSECRPLMAYKRSKIEGQPLELKPVATPVDKMVVNWLVSGGGIDETNWDEEMVGVCVHVLRMKAKQTARHGRECPLLEAEGQ